MSHHNQGVGRCDWRTPDWILERVRKVFKGAIHLDPATSPDNPTNALWTLTEGGLEENWSEAENVYMNPPWSKELGMPIWWWAARLWSCSQEVPNRDAIALYPASTNAAWFHNYAWDSEAICFPKGRVVYKPPPGFDSDDAPTFDSAIVYFGPNRVRFMEAFGDKGVIR